MKVSGARTTDIEGRSPEASAGARAGERENASRPTDARSIQLALARGRQTPPTGDETSAKAAERMLARWGAAAPRRVIKIALGLSLVGSLGWGPLRLSVVGSRRLASATVSLPLSATARTAGHVPLNTHLECQEQSPPGVSASSSCRPPLRLGRGDHCPLG